MCCKVPRRVLAHPERAGEVREAAPDRVSFRHPKRLSGHEQGMRYGVLGSQGAVWWIWLGGTGCRKAIIVSNIEPLLLKAAHASGDHTPANFIRVAVKRWTQFILDDGIKFTGPYSCAKMTTGGRELVSRPIGRSFDSSFRGVHAIEFVACETRARP